MEITKANGLNEDILSSWMHKLSNNKLFLWSPNRVKTLKRSLQGPTMYYMHKEGEGSIQFRQFSVRCLRQGSGNISQQNKFLIMVSTFGSLFAMTRLFSSSETTALSYSKAVSYQSRRTLKPAMFQDRTWCVQSSAVDCCDLVSKRLKDSMEEALRSLWAKDIR